MHCIHSALALNYYFGILDVLLTLTADKEAATRDEGATLTCTASIGFPPFSAISFIKNGKTVATSTSGQLQIDTKSVNANPFGLYICQLNASGLAFNETIILKDQGNFKSEHNTTPYCIILNLCSSDHGKN